MTPTLATLRDFRQTFGPAFVDVIHVYADLNDRIRGMAGYRTAFGFRRSAWRTTLSLVEFARQTFGGGQLRRIADDADGARYVVLAPTPQPVGKASVFPAWTYHV
jgi:hypothetical protein